MTETCGWLIKGDAARPCVKKPGHKSRHRDAAEAERMRKWREENREYKRKHYQENREAYLERNRKYREENPEYQRKWREENREAYLEYMRKWREENPEYKRKWNAANPEKRAADHHKRRARKRGVPRLPWTKPQLIDLYGSRCWLCHKELGYDWHADHVIPISRGGFDMPFNLRPSCPPCNGSKHDRLVGDPAVVVPVFYLMWQVMTWAQVTVRSNTRSEK